MCVGKWFYDPQLYGFCWVWCMFPYTICNASDSGMLTHLWPLVGQSFHYLWRSIEWTSTVGLQQSALLEMIGKAEVSQLQSQRERENIK